MREWALSYQYTQYLNTLAHKIDIILSLQHANSKTLNMGIIIFLLYCSYFNQNKPEKPNKYPLSAIITSEG
jgi:hypothetical protein